MKFKKKSIKKKETTKKKIKLTWVHSTNMPPVKKDLD
jgi:hypothetical protein